MKTNSKLIIVIVCIILSTLISFADDATIIEVYEGDLVNLKISAKDADADVLTYTYDNPLNSSGQWQTTYGDYGEWDVNIKVSDGENEVVKPVTIRVYKSNRPPVLQELADIVVYETETVTISPLASDYEGDTLTYTISNPIGSDGKWETTYEDAGEYLVTITASDGEHEVSQEVLVVIEDINRDPKIKDYSPKKDEVELEEGEKLSFVIAGEDPDDDVLTYSWSLDGVEVSTEESYTYEADFESAGEHSLKASVSDGSVIMSVSWNIQVEDVNRVPTLEEVDDIVVNEGDLVVVEFTAEDPDGDNIRYSISDPVGDDKEWQTTYEDAGTYEIKLIISDGEEEISQEFNVIVKDVDRAPDFTEIEDIEITELESVEFKLEATDADGDEVTFSAENLPEGATFDEDEFSFKTSYETLFKPKHWTTTVLKFLRLDNLVYGKRKAFPVKFIATGKEKSSEQIVKIIVNNLNRAPILQDLEDITVNEGEWVVVTPQAVEYDNDRVKFTVSWPIGNNGKWKTGFDDSDTYPITVTASDGEFTDTKELSLTVNHVNRAPTLEPLKEIEINEGETASLVLDAVDPDGDDLELSLGSMPLGAEFVDGVFTWTPDNEIVDYRDGTSSFALDFTAADWEQTAAQSTTIIVNDVNRAPEFVNSTPEESMTIEEDSYIIFRAGAEDPDGDSLTYTWKFGLFDKVSTEEPAVKRTFYKSGTKKVKLIISDGELTAEKVWTIEVTEKGEVEEPETPAAKIVSYGGKTYKLSLYAGEDLTSTEKLVQKDGEQYKLTVV